jgi:hypothetical protein
MISHPFRRIAAGTILALAAIAAAVLVFALGSSPPVFAAAESTTSPNAIAHYGIFRRVAMPADTLPVVNVSDALSSPALTRAQSTGYTQYGQWATLNGDELCVVNRFTPPSSPNGAPDTSRACNSAEYLETHSQLLVQMSLMGGTSSTPPTPGLANLFSGVVPDGVAAVTLEFADGTQQVVPVNNNGFTFSSAPELKSLTNVTWVGASGTQLAENK